MKLYLSYEEKMQTGGILEQCAKENIFIGWNRPEKTAQGASYELSKSEKMSWVRHVESIDLK
jgi:hypothetical protein